MSLRQILTKIDSQVEVKKDYSLGPHVNWSSNATQPVHRWYRYREAYSPDLIDKLGLGHRILDPFCGCGSIMIGAAQRGLESVGVDINPLAVFATNVKMDTLPASDLELIESFLSSLNGAVRTANEWPRPELSITEKVFEPEILSTLMKIRWSFETAFEGNNRVRDFIKLGWLSILETVGSYYKEGNGIKYRSKKRQRRKYVDRPDGEWQLERFGNNQAEFVIETFLGQMQLMLTDCSAWKTGSWHSQKAVLGSSRELDRLDLGSNFDSIVFSPPYANRFDYFESLKVELWFGNFVGNYLEAQSLRKKSLRSHLGADLKMSSRSFPPLEEILAVMDKETSSWKMGIQSLLRGYFDDMFETLVQCSRLQTSGECHVVVGNSAFAGAIVPTDTLIAALGLQAGYQSVRVNEARHLTVSPQQRSNLLGFEEFMRESVVSFSK